MDETSLFLCRLLQQHALRVEYSLIEYLRILRPSLRDFIMKKQRLSYCCTKAIWDKLEFHMGRATCQRGRPQFWNSFMVKERGGGAATVWAKVQAVFSTLTPPAARAAGVHFGQARIPILKRSSGVSLGCSAITATFLFLRIYTQTRRPRRGSCRDVTLLPPEKSKGQFKFGGEQIWRLFKRVRACLLEETS